MLSPQSTVLLVDDEIFLREMLVRTLKGAHFAVVEAANGALALEAALKLDGSLVLLVTDISMPVMDGLECARQFRVMKPGVSVPLH